MRTCPSNIVKEEAARFGNRWTIWGGGKSMESKMKPRNLGMQLDRRESIADRNGECAGTGEEKHKGILKWMICWKSVRTALDF